MIPFKWKNVITEAELFDDRLSLFYKTSELFYSYVGVNYNKNEITSLKFYYVFFDPSIFEFNFPLIALKHDYEKSIERSSSSVFNYLSNGGGITLTIKFNKYGNSSIGYYLRQQANDHTYTRNIINNYPELNLTPNDFEQDYGEYCMLIGGRKEKTYYVYLRPSTHLSLIEKACGIKFSSAKGIEISSANINDRSAHKFIAMGGPELIGEDFLKKIPADFLNLTTSTGAKLICPATSINFLNNSCYAYKNKSNLVSEFLNKIKK